MPGSIPAYAGDPCRSSEAGARSEVYPRLRGGSSSPASSSPTLAGLSPPTRGIRRHIGIGKAFRGSIPAYAGDPF